MTAKNQRQPQTEPQDNSDNSGLVTLTTSIVTAYVQNNAVGAEQLPAMIREVHASLRAAQVGQPPLEELKPAVPIRKSVTKDFLICLEDGQKFKSLKRHLATHYNLTPEQYREKWGLPKDYPMTAPSYSQARSDMAKKSGLGRGGRPRIAEGPARKRA
jgi:predicted transcriptional regulator